MTTTMYAFVDQSDLELMFTVERVAQVFSVQAADGSTSGTADPTRIAHAIRMGSAEAARILMPVNDMAGPSFTTPLPDTLKQLVGPLVMHWGAMSRPEYNGDPKTSPYQAAWEQARKDLKEVREAYQRLAKDQKPANIGGQIAMHAPLAVQPFTFLGNASTGDGGFNSGSF